MVGGERDNVHARLLKWISTCNGQHTAATATTRVSKESIEPKNLFRTQDELILPSAARHAIQEHNPVSKTVRHKNYITHEHHLIVQEWNTSHLGSTATSNEGKHHAILFRVTNHVPTTCTHIQSMSKPDNHFTRDFLPCSVWMRVVR